MCCSALKVKGGMTSVLRNYLEYDKWDCVKIKYTPTHIDRTGILGKIVYFAIAMVRIFFTFCFGKVDIVHLHVSDTGSFTRKAMIVRLAKRFNKPVILHHHAANFDDYYRSLSDKKKVYVCNIFDTVDVNIVLSKRLVPMIMDKCKTARAIVVYNAVPTYDRNLYNTFAHNILFLGRIEERKGVYDLIDVIAELDSKIDKKYKFMICGDYEIEKARGEIATVGMQHRIERLGWIDNEEKMEVFQKTCINVLPSYNEGLPMTILETMAFGIPNVTTAIASIPEVITNYKNGILITPGDKNALAKAIQYLLSHPNERKAMSDASYQTIEDNFSLKNNLKIVTNLYRELA